MILKCFALFDRKAGFYMQPSFFPSIGQAVRAVTDMCADPSTVVARYPADFDLYYLSDFDDAGGSFSAIPVTHLGNCEGYMPRSKE